MALLTHGQHWFSLAGEFLFACLNEERCCFPQVPLWLQFPTVASVSLPWTCGEGNLLIIVCQQVVVARDWSINTWKAQSMCHAVLYAHLPEAIQTKIYLFVPLSISLMLWETEALQSWLVWLYWLQVRCLEEVGSWKNEEWWDRTGAAVEENQEQQLLLSKT